MNTFANIVEEIKSLSVDEIEELHLITEKFLIENRREEIFRHHKDSLSEFENGKLSFSSDLQEQQKRLKNL